MDRILSGATTPGQSGAMVMKGYSTFLKAPRLEPHYQINVISGHSLEESYSTAPADWAN